MKLRNVAVSLAAATAIAGSSGLAVVAFSGVAGAAVPQGTTVQAALPISPDPSSGETVTPGTPYASGQTIEVKVPANTALVPGTAVKVIECADPGGLPANLPVSTAGCDTTTINSTPIALAADGSFDYKNYQVYQLPDPLFDPSPTSCGTSATPCVLWIGDDYSSKFTVNQLWSQPFQVVDTATDLNGENPGDGTPEVPLAIGLPLAAGGLFAGGLVLRRRRSAKASAA
jgi:hypothetical protein